MFEYLNEVPNKITEQIYQSGYRPSENKSVLLDIGITHILIASSVLKDYFPNDFKYLKLNVVDDNNEDMFKYFEEVYKFVDDCIENNGKILIHCAAGISRSSTCTISYLIKKYKISYEKAY